MKSWAEDFKRFLVKGNLVTTAVALVMALVFAALVKAFIADLITPIIAMIFGKANFSELSFTINGSHFYYGDFINALITFVITAAAVFFFVVKPYETWDSRRAKDDEHQGLSGVHDQDPGRSQAVSAVHSGAGRCFGERS